MDLTMENLEAYFCQAIKGDYCFIAVKVQMEGFEMPEIIINAKENFKTKMDYYKNAYDENLVLKSFNGIKIIGFSYSDSFQDLEDDLVNF